MMRKRVYHIVAIGLLALASCGTQSTDGIEPTVSGVVRFSSDISRAGETTAPADDGTTFRFAAYQPGTMNFKHTGTYVYDMAQDATFLVASRLDDNGKYVAADALAGINGVAGTYKVVALSPGLKEKIFNDSTMAVITCPNRVDDADADAGAVYAADAEQKELGEYATIRFANPLREIRSRIGFEVSKDADLAEEISVTDIKVMGAGTGKPDEQLYYFPNTRQCAVPEGVDDVMDFGAPNKVVDADGSYRFVSGKKYILSGIYAPRSVVLNILNVDADNINVQETQYLSMRMDFKQGTRSVSAEIMLNADAEGLLAELKSRHEYIFKVTVASTYIKIYLNVYDHSGSILEWQNPGSSGSNAIGGPDETIKIGTFNITNWTDNNYGNQEIE
ncbi:MAG: hypothetical protein ACI4AN_05370 [Muribaculaceae bacterium]